MLLHIIDNIELKLDCKVLIANQIAISVQKQKKIAIRYFLQIAQPYSSVAIHRAVVCLDLDVKFVPATAGEDPVSWEDSRVPL